MMGARGEVSGDLGGAPTQVVAGGPPEGALRPRAADAVRARHHPWALAGVWAWQTSVAFAAGWPASSLVRAAYGAGARGDAPLWDAGGHALLDFLWHARWGLAPATAAAELAILGGAVAGLLPAAALMVVLSYADRDGAAPGLARSLGTATRMLPSLALMLGVVTAAQVAILGLGAAAASVIEDAASQAMGEGRAQRTAAVVVVLLAAAASVLGVVHDLARAAVVQSRARGLRALVFGARVFQSSAFSLWWSWAWRALAALGPVVAVAAVAERIGGHGGWTLVLLASLHQAVVLSRVALRSSWLARALRSVAP